MSDALTEKSVLPNVESVLTFISKHAKAIGMIMASLLSVIPVLVSLWFSDIVTEPSIWSVFYAGSLGFMIVPGIFLIYSTIISFILQKDPLLLSRLSDCKNKKSSTQYKLFRVLTNFFLPCTLLNQNDKLRKELLKLGYLNEFKKKQHHTVFQKRDKDRCVTLIYDKNHEITVDINL